MFMTLTEYKNRYQLSGSKITQAVSVYLLRNDKILLGERKSKLGNGIYSAIGGKLEKGENYKQAAVRELKEEIGVRIKQKDLIKFAVFDFYFLDKTSWNQRVVMYFCRDWKGKIKESNEMIPRWFSLDKIPYQKMWDDSRYYLPFALEGKRVKAEFLYEGMKVVKAKMIIRN